MGYNQSALAVLIGLLVLGCAEELPTRPGPVPKLPATPISSRIVVDTSQTLRVFLEADSAYSIDFGSTELFQTGAFDDIAISFLACSTFNNGVIDLYDYSSPSWKALSVAFRIRLSGPPGCPTGYRLVSQIETAAPGHFLSPSGLLLVQTSAVNVMYARLLRYSDDYHFTTVRTEYLEHTSLCYANNSLYAAMGDGLDDSLFAFDLEGNRRWAIACEPHEDSRSAFDGTYFWTQAPREHRLIQMDTLGNVIASIVSDLGYIRDIVWANGSLWCLNENVFQIDVDSSLARGTVVAQHRFPAPPNVMNARMAVDSIGPIICGGVFEHATFKFKERLYRYTLAGELRGTFDYEPRVWAIAWDGESLWAMHMGPRGAITNAKLLTRFTLE